MNAGIVHGSISQFKVNNRWELTEEEKIFFLNKMEEYCKKKEGKTLKELWNEYQ